MSLAPLIARQPIIDEHRTVVAYELLFRAHDRERAVVLDDQRATAHVLVEAFADIGLDALVGARKACVNVSREFLLEFDPLPFAPDRVILELLEDAEPDDALLERISRLVVDGYSIALDDFTHDETREPLLRVARIVKLDVRALGLDGVARELAKVEGYGVVPLAEKVETEEEFERCRELGFKLFQGWFFCRPLLVEGSDLPPARMATLTAAAELTSADLTFEDLERIVSADPGLALRLLRLLNSAAFPIQRRIATIREALVMLGERAVRQWALLMMLAGMEPTWDELLPTALIRARLLRELSVARGDADPEAAFFVGLFSVADALARAPLHDVLAQLPLVDEHRAALLHHDGPNGALLRAVVAHEAGRVNGEMAAAGLDLATFAAAYLEAVRWAQEWGPRVAEA